MDQIGIYILRVTFHLMDQIGHIYIYMLKSLVGVTSSVSICIFQLVSEIPNRPRMFGMTNMVR